MTEYRFARRSAILGNSVFDHVPGTIALSSGAAYPPCLPDVVREATEAVGPLREEAMQYAPLMGLDDLRDEICAFVAKDGVKAARENVLVTYGSKSAFDLALRTFCEAGRRGDRDPPHLHDGGAHHAHAWRPLPRHRPG